jgi:outer membrane immunogenic protein
MIRKLALSITALLAGSSMAMAADMPVKAPVPVPVEEYNWSGFYIGGFVGGVWGETSTFASGSGVPITIEPSGVVAGVHAGVDWQLANRIVLGLRVAAPFGVNLEETVVDPTFPTTVRHIAELNWAVLFTGHIGMAYGRWLPYIGGGLAVAEGKGTFSSPGGTGSSEQLHTGFTALAGIRYGFSDRWWGAIQYNYTDLGSETYTAAPAFTGTRVIDFKSHSVTGMLSYRLGGR